MSETKNPSGHTPSEDAERVVPSVLIVDDHPPNLLALEAVLEPLDIRIVRASSGTEALEQLLRRDFAAIVLDVQMPGMDGFETAAVVRQRARTREVPILFVTAIHHDDVYQARGYEHGAVDYITKPFNPDVLRAKVSALVDLWRRDETLRRRETSLFERERARLASAVRQRDEQLRLIIDGVHDHAISMLDARGRVLTFNAPAERIKGYSAAEVLGQFFGIFFTPEDRAAGMPEKELAIANERGRFEGEGWRQRKDGSRFYAAVSLSQLRDEAGEVVGYVKVTQDRTASRREAEERDALLAAAQASRREAEALATQLKAQNRLTRTITDNATSALFMMDERQYCTFMNPAAEAMTGFTFGEVRALDRPLHEIIHHTRPDGRRYPQEECAIDRALPRNVQEKGEDVFVHRDGRFYTVAYTASPIVEADVPAGTVVEVRDITEERRGESLRQHAEQSFRVLAEAGTVLGASLDLEITLRNVMALVVPALADWACMHLREDDGTLRLAAAAHVDPSREVLVRESFEQHPLPADAPFGYSKVIRTGESELVTDFANDPQRRQHSDADRRAMLETLHVKSLICVPLTVAGQVRGALTLAVGETDRRYAADDLQLAEELGRRVAVALDRARLFDLTQRERARAEEANRAKDEFLSVASHELRTPLNAILGWSRMLRSGALPEEKRERALEIIERNARVQVQLVEDILDVSRIITGKLRLNIAAVEPAQVVDAAVDVVKPAADAKGVRVQLLLEPDAGTIMGDGARLQQVIWNLLANAIKFTPRGGRVHVRMQRRESAVEIAVSDTGQGIDPAFLPHVFLPFRQADASVTRTHGGLGLGLAIVKHLVELHGGGIEAYSEGTGQGATFTVRIPIAPVRSTSITPPPPDPNASKRDGARVSCPPEISSLKILVVDDEADARDLIQSILEQCGAAVRTAGSAREAYELFRGEVPDVVVSDVGMPGEDGYSFIRRIRALPAAEGGRTPAVALTAYARMEDRTRALIEGFTNHVSKPVEPQELIAVIAALSGRHTRPGEKRP